MSESPTRPDELQEALEDHRQLHFLFDQIEVTLETLVEGQVDSEPLARLAAQIDGLTERLVEHQTTEEDGGLFELLLDALPESRNEIARLMADHERMIKILQMARIHTRRMTPDGVVALREDMRKFLGEFRRHEADEERLIRLVPQRERATGD